MLIFLDVVGPIAHQGGAEKLNTAHYINVHIDVTWYEVLFLYLYRRFKATIHCRIIIV